jgi:hypothetical protein
METVAGIAILGGIGALMWLAVKRGKGGGRDGSDGAFVFDSGSSDSASDCGDAGGGDCGGGGGGD